MIHRTLENSTPRSLLIGLDVGQDRLEALIIIHRSGSRHQTIRYGSTCILCRVRRWIRQATTSLPTNRKKITLQSNDRLLL